MSTFFTISALLKVVVGNLLEFFFSFNRGHPFSCTPKITSYSTHFTQCLYRNQDQNNNLPTKFSQCIHVTDATSSKLTCSWLPDIPELYAPSKNDKLAKWALMFVDFPENISDGTPFDFDYTDIVLIESGDYSLKTLRFSSKKRYDYSKWKNRTAILFNPFFVWDIKPEPIISFNHHIKWHKKYISPAGFFQRQDHQFVLLVNGESRNYDEFPRQRVGAFITSAPWTGKYFPLNNGEYIFKGPQHADSFQITSLIQAENPGVWFGFGNVRRGNQWRICAVRFTEDFANIKYFENLVVPASNLPNKYGEYFPDIVWFKGKYRLMWCNLVSSNIGERFISEAISENILGPFDPATTGNKPVFSNASDNDGIFRSSHTTQTSYFVWKGKLYCIYDGTSRWKASGTRGNRVFGLAHYNEATTDWVEDPRNPIFINPMYGDKIWGAEWRWCSDHLGGKQILYQTDQDDLILFFSGCCGTDSYRPGCARLKRKALV